MAGIDHRLNLGSSNPGGGVSTAVEEHKRSTKGAE